MIKIFGFFKNNLFFSYTYYMRNIWRGICIYFIIINVTTFCIRGRDKWQAKKNKWRISEKRLLQLSSAGGRLGAIFAIEFFKHKTIKGSFLWKFYTIGGIWILALFGLALMRE